MRKALHYILIGIFFGLILKLFVLDIPCILGNSMESTIRDREHVIVNKLAYGLDKPFGSTHMTTWAHPKAGDIIVYMHNGDMVVKRCVACSGMPLDFSCDSQYTLKVGGENIPLTYEQYRLLDGITSVPEGCVFAVGDNYQASIDSRNYGFIPECDVLGKVLWK